MCLGSSVRQKLIFWLLVAIFPFLSVEANGVPGDWTSDGCSTSAVDDHGVTCSCDHPGNFAIRIVGETV